MGGGNLSELSVKEETPYSRVLVSFLVGTTKCAHLEVLGHKGRQHLLMPQLLGQ